MKRDALRAAIAALSNKPPVKVNVPEIGDMYVRRLTVGEVEDQSKDTKSEDQMRYARALARVLVDEDGALLYDRNSEDDLALLAQAPFDLMAKALAASNKASGLDDDDGKEAEKN